MAIPVLASAVARVLMTTGSKSIRSVVLKTYNRSGKTISQKELFNLARTPAGIKKLEKLYRKYEKLSASRKVKKASTPKTQSRGARIQSTTSRNISDHDNISQNVDDKESIRDPESLEARQELSALVIARLNSLSESDYARVEGYFHRLAENILSGRYGAGNATYEEIRRWITSETLSRMIDTFKVEGIYY